MGNSPDLLRPLKAANLLSIFRTGFCTEVNFISSISELLALRSLIPVGTQGTLQKRKIMMKKT